MPPIRPAHQSVHDVEQLSQAGLNMVDFLSDAMLMLRATVPHVAACLATHDLSTGLLTGLRKFGKLVGRNEADVLYSQLEHAVKEGTRFQALARDQVPAVGMHLLTGGDVQRSIRMRELVLPYYGFSDEARLLVRDGPQRWGVLSLFRGPEEPPFSRTDIALLSRFSKHFARGIRRGVLLQKASARGAEPTGPAILIVDRDDNVIRTTPSARARLADMARDHHSGSPYAVIASLANAARRASAPGTDSCALLRLRGTSGTWLTLQAVPLSGDDELANQAAIIIEESKPSESQEVVIAAYGLTVKEQAVLELVLDGRETNDIARLLQISPHTVNEHLRALFTKVDVHSRGELVARVLENN